MKALLLNLAIDVAITISAFTMGGWILGVLAIAVLTTINIWSWLAD